jgi:hypothetical protein
VRQKNESEHEKNAIKGRGHEQASEATSLIDGHPERDYPAGGGTRCKRVECAYVTMRNVGEVAAKDGA